MLTRSGKSANNLRVAIEEPKNRAELRSSPVCFFGKPLFPFSKSLRIKSGQQDHRIGIRRDIIGKIDRELVSRTVRGIN